MQKNTLKIRHPQNSYFSMEFCFSIFRRFGLRKRTPTRAFFRIFLKTPILQKVILFLMRGRMLAFRIGTSKNQPESKRKKCPKEYWKNKVKHLCLHQLRCPKTIVRSLSKARRNKAFFMVACDWPTKRHKSPGLVAFGLPNWLCIRLGQLDPPTHRWIAQPTLI